MTTIPFDDTTTPGSVTLLPEVLAAIAAVKGHEPVQPVPASAADVCPIAAAVVQQQERRKAAQVTAQRKALDEKVGQQMGTDGIFMGQVTLLGRTFNVFAAPQDLTNEAGQVVDFKVGEAQARLATLTDFNGHDGTNFKDDQEFMDALENSTYDGGWVIPPRLLLVGTDNAGSAAQPANIVTCAQKDKLPGIDKASKYLSSSFNEKSFVTVAEMPKGTISNGSPGIARGKCRPVRLVLA